MDRNEGELAQVATRLHMRAPAKVNLSLQVLSRRADGYHDLATHMQKVSLYDELELCLTKQSGVSLVCSDGDIPLDEKNLAVRAALAYLARSSRVGQRGVRISLEKNIPVGAGLGGGSSDAGTVLRGLNQLLDNEFSEEELIEMARPLGADVPFFASEMSAAFATGIGDILQPLESTKEFDFILVNPGIFISTKEIFERFSLTLSPKRNIFARPFRVHERASLLDYMHNDLEEIVSDLCPAIDEMKSLLEANGASAVMMSGSGSTVFGVFQRSVGQKKINQVCKVLSCKYGEKVFAVQAV
ncbi:4-(cytidine 5'-diphospho)-2-C-methyl-D-erythritol kinase [Desulfotalea psychrophila]|uniref:4-diphosphocytidyl-2-C-methyl-D-erythritol kinase n=1 Tax=Desulfotalea psychrophila (strain LSv54 / DSM 12343) TaxID=177439 RepID=ISPE_DESPS|nr:4-(cytidine 5'-diphospho)-2-C-methyl-D-erythritol kinase [Desulfotalea psychrophila]Q6AJL6.1 RecName: Full=4-diphosphocytidyl-2-C-methyl-D-erythritol kinase; Short=CMK; AltName: Full=4-(cytidine-5'-diphospho)-2-C-methyl-D-erythritol kinase [Desulfotalea psychrophila LSv54]CAG37464.1 related to 4-diphosphocytidyl-2-C-methyl-D-erythritol kinase [Desulfotalea psychrophila LSv54]